MRIPKQVEELYTQCMNCPVPQNVCQKAWKDFSGGIVPRAFDICLRRFPKLLVVAKNPGHPLDRFSERQLYAGKKGKRLFQSHLIFRKEFAGKIMDQADASLRFHKNRNRYLRYFLGHTKKLESFEEYRKRAAQSGRLANDHEKIMRGVALTNLFKCSTENEQEKLKVNDVATCFERYFIPEVRLLKPRVILALGNEVEDILNRLGKDKRLPPIVKIKHPSYFYKKDIEARELSKVRKTLVKYLK